MYEYYKPSELELSILELLREFRCLSRGQIDQLYKNDPGLDIALNNLHMYGMIKYDMDRDVYCATRHDEVIKHQLTVMDIFLSTIPDEEDKMEVLLNSTIGANYDIGYPLGEKFIYLIYADNTSRVTKASRLAGNIKANHGDLSRSKILIVLRNAEDAILVPKSEIDTEVYTLKGGKLCTI